MKSMYLVMVLCVSLVNAEDSGTGSEPTGTQPPSSNDSASDLDTRHDYDDKYHHGHVSCSGVQTASCVNQGGACQVQCDATSQYVLRGGCLGNCFCCAPKPATCTAFANCTSAKGSCSTTACLVTQKTVVRGCTGSTCLCCAPRDCDPTLPCKRAGGYCALTCVQGHEVIANGCSGTQCQCCAKRCTASDDCRRRRGACVRRNCRGSERLVSYGCGGQGCRCCAPSIRDVEDPAAIEAAESAKGDVSGEQTNEETVVKQEEGGEAEISEQGEVEETIVRGGEGDGEEGVGEDHEDKTN